jgi:hypothetical protein
MRALTIAFLYWLGSAGLQAQKTPTLPTVDSLELAGDQLDETLETFQTKHPKAVCVNSDPKIKNCYQWDDISVYGLTARPAPGCSPKLHSSPGCAQGLTAQFKKGYLTNLVYAVEGTDKSDAVADLKKKYGTPTLDTLQATIWLTSIGMCSVVVGKATEGPEGHILITLMIGNP